MKLLGKNLVLLSAAGLAGLCAVATDANANTSADDLYSETIYIQKSSAEVPTSLDSNARPNADSAQVASAPARSIESMSDLDSAGSEKKVSTGGDE